MTATQVHNEQYSHNVHATEYSFSDSCCSGTLELSVSLCQSHCILLWRLDAMTDSGTHTQHAASISCGFKSIWYSQSHAHPSTFSKSIAYTIYERSWRVTLILSTTYQFDQDGYVIFVPVYVSRDVELSRKLGVEHQSRMGLVFHVDVTNNRSSVKLVCWELDWTADDDVSRPYRA